MLEYNLKIDLNRFETEKSYYRDGKKCIFDSVRKKLIIETPEEIIRQKFVKHLTEELGVPFNKIDLEVPMSYFSKGARGRADIVVYNEADEPAIVIECKAPNVLITDNVWDQVIKYDKVLLTEIIIVTNGDETYAATWVEDEGQYFFIELPNYKQILKGEGLKYFNDNYTPWKRPPFSKTPSKEIIQEFEDCIGEDTSGSLYPLIINLAGFFFDQTIVCSPIVLGDLNIIEDGIRYCTFGNAAGGSWPGMYKYFILEDEKGNSQIISFLVTASMKTKNHPTFGNRKGRTTLVVAIDDFDKSHNSLQLNLDNYTEHHGDKYKIWHDGSLTAGKKGRQKNKEVIEFISRRDSSLIDNEGKVILGTFNLNKEIKWDDTTKKFIKNLIKYSILRDEFRRLKEKE